MTDPKPLSSNDVIVMGLVGVLLHLRVDADEMRRKVRSAFSKRGVRFRFRSLYPSIDEGLKRAANKNLAIESLRNNVMTLIDELETAAAHDPIELPGYSMLRELSGETRYGLLSFQGQEATERALSQLDIRCQDFSHIEYVDRMRLLEPFDDAILSLMHAVNETPQRLLFVGATAQEIRCAQRLKKPLAAKSIDLLTIGVGEDRYMIAESPDYVVTDIGEIPSTLRGERRQSSMSIVLLAYNEQNSLATAVDECRHFLNRHFHEWEVIVVDDGSHDRTAAIADQLAKEDQQVRVIHHDRNLGMGASMRSGYSCASCDYVTMLPADRQIRADSLIAFLGHLHPKRVVVSLYLRPPSGRYRKFQSWVFRSVMRTVAGVRITLEGAYVVPRALLEEIDSNRIGSQTFYYSFELLEAIRRKGYAFYTVFVRPFAREFGTSRVSSLGRIIKIVGEVARRRGGR